MWRQILSLAAILRDHLHRSGKTQDNVSLRIQNRFGQPKICLFQVQVQVIRVAVAAASWVHLITSTWMTIIRRQAQAYQSQQGQQLTVDQGYQVVGSIIVRVPPGTAQVTLSNRTEWVPTTAKYVRKNFPMAAQKTPLCSSRWLVQLRCREIGISIVAASLARSHKAWSQDQLPVAMLAVLDLPQYRTKETITEKILSPNIVSLAVKLWLRTDLWAENRSKVLLYSRAKVHLRIKD